MSLETFFFDIEHTLKGRKFENCSLPLFRGHSKKNYELLPTLLRCSNTGKNVWELENNLYCDFRSLVGPRIKFDDSWQMLFAMRHEGIPTRLLDWTETMGTALFFALDSDDLDDPHIWILNPYKMNETNFGKAQLINPEEDLAPYEKTYAQKCLNEGIYIKELPIAVYPNRSNDRLFAQRGLFTIHGTSDKKMEDTCSDCLEKVRIPDNLIGTLKKLLHQFGINKYSVYPDFKGLSDYLKDIYKY